MWAAIIVAIFQTLLYWALHYGFRKQVDRYLEAIRNLRAEADRSSENLLKQINAINDAHLVAVRAENERLVAIIRQETGFKKPEKVQPS